MPKSPLLKKQAMDALFETMTTDSYDSLGAHRRGESTPESKGTEFEALNEQGFSGSPAIIPAEDLAQAPDPADAEFFKESDPRTASFEVEAAVDPRIKIKIEYPPVPPYQTEAEQAPRAYRAVAYLGKEEVGHLGCSLSTDENGKTAKIGLAEVSDSQRGTGLGQALYDRAIAQAKKMGCTTFRSDTSLSQDAHKAWGRLSQRYPVQSDPSGYSISLKESHSFEDDPQVIPVEDEMAEHEFVKQSPKQAAPSTSRSQSPEWGRITEYLSKRGYRWLGNVSDGTEMWANLKKQFFYDPATHTWTHKTDGKTDAQGAIEDMETAIPKIAKVAHGSYPDPGQGKYDSAHEAHVREEAKQWSQYAEEADNTEDIKPYDAAGNYLCGTCDMRRGSAACARVEGEISFGTGSCKLYHIGDPEDDAPMPKPFSKKEVKYGEHHGGFGCHRCEYGGEAKQPDMEGREGWCSFWGMHVETNACCAEWDQDSEKDKAAEKENKEVEKARKSSADERVRTPTGDTAIHTDEYPTCVACGETFMQDPRTKSDRCSECRRKGHYGAAKPKCPHCGSSDYGLMPTDFETAKCNACGKNWDHGIVDGINNPYPKKASKLAPGGKGEDRNGEYEVVAIKGNQITYKYSDGTTQTGDLQIKQRINDGIEAERARANAPKKVPGYLAEDEILWTPEMAHFIGYLAGPGRAKIFAEAPPKYEEAVVNKYHDLTGVILDESPGKFNIAPETKWSPEMTVMFKPTEDMPDEVARIAQKPGLVNRNQFAWSLIRQGFRIGERPNVEAIRSKVPAGLHDYFDLGADYYPPKPQQTAQASVEKTAAKALYHVTRTDAVPKIQKKGILPMQTSNWVRGESGERYGGGEVFAFDHVDDAVRWAAKMDWDFNKGMGTGKISIVIFDPGTSKWEEDTADPLNHAMSKGSWLKSLQAVKPEQIKKVVPVTIDMTRAVVQGKGVKLEGMEKEADVPTKSYGMGTPIGGTDNPDAGATDDPEEGAAGEDSLMMTGSEEEYDPEVEDAAFMAALDAEEDEAEKRACYFASIVDGDDLDVVGSKFASSEEISWFSKSARPTPQKIELLQKQFKLTPEQIELCIATDPSPNQSDFVAWIAKFLSKAAFQLPEDSERIKDQLAKFQKFKKSPAFLFSKDIQQYDPAKLFETLTEAETKGMGSKKEEKRETVRKGAELVVQEGDVKIFRVTTPEAARELGSGTNWCTAAPGSSYAATYLKDGPLYVFFDGGSAVAQLHCESNQFMNRSDVCILESVTGDSHDRSMKKFLADPALAKALQMLAAKEPNVAEWAKEKVADPEDVKKILGEAAEAEIAENVQYEKEVAQYDIDYAKYLKEMEAFKPKNEKWHKEYEKYQEKQNEYQKKLEDWQAQDPSHGTSENPVPFWLDRERPKAPQRPDEPRAPYRPGRGYDRGYGYQTRWGDSIQNGKKYVMQVKHALASGQPLAPEIEAKLVESGIPTDLLLKYGSQFHPGQPWEPLAQAIMRDVKAGKSDKKAIIDYAVKFLKGRWTEAEPLFLSKMFLLQNNMQAMQRALEYATRVVKGRWPEFETAIQKAKPGLASGYGAAEYAIHAVKQPWHQLSGIKKKKNGRINAEECMIKGNPGEARKYAEAFFQGKRWEEFEKSGLEADNLAALINYAADTLHARMPELEEKILSGTKDAQESKGRKRYRKYTDLPLEYAKKVIKGRWPEYEAKILAHLTKPAEETKSSYKTDSYEPSKRHGYGYSTWARDGKFPSKISHYIEQVVQGRWVELEQILLARYQQFPAEWTKNQNLVDGYLVTLDEGAKERHKNDPAPAPEAPKEDSENIVNQPMGTRTQKDPNTQQPFTKYQNDPSAHWAEGEKRLITRDEGYEELLVNELRARAAEQGEDTHWTKDKEEKYAPVEKIQQMEKATGEVNYKERETKPAWTIWNGIWIGWWGMDRIEKYTDYMLANGQSWDLGIDILEIKEDIEDVRGRYGFENRTVRRQPKAQGATASMKYQSSLLKKKALVDMHESPTMLPPRDDIRRHIDEQEQDAIDADVMQGVNPANVPVRQPGQIDPRINPSGRAASKLAADTMWDMPTFKRWWGKAKQTPQTIKENFSVEKVPGFGVSNGAIRINWAGNPIGYIGFPLEQFEGVVGPIQRWMEKGKEDVDPYKMEVISSAKAADYTDQDWMDDEAAEYQLDQVRDAEREAKRHFMQEDYIQQIADDYIPPKTMDEMWDIMGDEYTAEFYGTPYTRVPDFTDQETEGWEGKRLSSWQQNHSSNLRSQSCPNCKTAKMKVVDDGMEGGTTTAALLHCEACDKFYTAI
jgi:predicted GNAT family acetyltransferase